MPVERQAERLVTPLTRRDKQVRWSPSGDRCRARGTRQAVLYELTKTGAAKGQKCFTATFAASIGGATVHYCGAAAVHYCRVNAATAPSVAEACRRAGFAVGATP